MLPFLLLYLLWYCISVTGSAWYCCYISGQPATTLQRYFCRPSCTNEVVYFLNISLPGHWPHSIVITSLTSTCSHLNSFYCANVSRSTSLHNYYRLLSGGGLQQNNHSIPYCCHTATSRHTCYSESRSEYTTMWCVVWSGPDMCVVIMYQFVVSYKSKLPSFFCKLSFLQYDVALGAIVSWLCRTS